MMNPEQNESFGINASIASEENANYAEENGGAPRGDPEEVVTGVAPSSSAPTTPVKNQSLEAHDTFTSSPTASEDNSDQRRPSSSRRQQRMRLIKCYALVAVVVIVLAVGIPLAAVYLFKDNDETSFNGAAATAPTEVSSSASDNQEPAVDVTSKPETPVIETDAPVVLEVTDSPVVVDTTEDETIEDDDTLEETPVETDAPLDEKNVTSTPEDVEEDMEEAVPEVPIEEDATDETTAPNNEETAIDAPNNQETATDAPNNQDTATDAPNNQETATDAPTDPVVLTIPPTDPNAESGPDRSDIYFELIEVTRPSVLEDSASPQALAHKWLVERDQLLPVPTGRKLIQRYALNVLDHVVRAPYLPVFSDPTIDECQWMGVTCNEEGDVIELRWNEQQLTGSLSAPEMKLLDKLEYVDMSGNSLTGDLENVYDTTSLKHIYLHHNKLSGSISERVGLLGSLESLNLQKNELTGSVPLSLRTIIGEGKQLRWLVLSHNKLSGMLPPDWRVRHLWYLDLSHNNLSGPLPNDWDNMMVRLRFLYLDNNSFTGTVPSYFSGLGNGRIKTMALDNNFLEGEVPSNWEVLNQLISLSFYNNNITTPMDPSICELSKYKQGEMVEMKVDCSICTCDTLCHTCVN